MKYAELSAKSCFSFLFGASHPEELVTEAKRLGYRGLTLIDRNGFYGMVRAYQRAKELSFPVAFGAEISLGDFDLRLLAKNFRGYQSICRLLSLGFQKGEKSKPLISEQDVLEWASSPDIYCLFPPKRFPNLNQIKALSSLQLVQLVTRSYQPTWDAKLRAHLAELPSCIPRAWTCEAYYHEASRMDLFQCLQAIRENKVISEISCESNGENYLKSLFEISQLQVPSEWLKNSCEIFESCTFSPAQIQYRYPREWLPEGLTPSEFLNALCREGLKERYPQGAPKNVLDQLKHELCLVQELSYEDYFLTVWDVVQFARSQNILCQGRGSAANSVICYLLGITSIDPVKMNLLFERFISKEREEAPDIDVDFEHERREEVIQYVYKKYGRHRAGMVATLITYRTRSSIRDLSKVLGSSTGPVFENFLSLLKGFPRHLGQHTGGMILCADRLDEISPIEPANMADRSVVQWDKYDIEKLGLLKIDFLGLGMLSCLRKSFDLLRKYRVADLELYKIPADDRKTYQMIQKSRTAGVFQIESRAQMSMLPRLKPKNFYDLVVEVAIVRPGPLQGGMVHPYLRRRMGLEKVEYAHPKLKPILEKTLGIPIFQEQVMKMAIEVAGFSPGEADTLRRAMGTFKKSGNLESISEDLCQRLISQNIPVEFAERICRQILGFGEYGFPESHAASFALLTYASSFLKAHHPAFFLCALLNSLPMGFYSQQVLIQCFAQEGLVLLPVDLDRSIWDHQIEALADGSWAVRLGFRVVRKMRKESVESFLKTRSEGDPDLWVFQENERSALALLTCRDRREGYWDSLKSKPRSLALKTSSAPPRFRELSKMQDILLDFELMECSLKEHPAKIIKDRHWDYSVPLSKTSSSEELSKMPAGRFVFVFGTLEAVQRPPTAKGMAFITLQDETGFLNLVLRPQVFRKYAADLEGSWRVLALGQIQKTQAYHSILVQQIITPISRKKPHHVSL